MATFKVKGLERHELTDQRIRDVLKRVPRHLFVPEAISKIAYEDRALPIGCGQTISQPFIVALMTQEAKIAPGAKVLEVGTGSGYQAAVLAELGARVFTMELITELAALAKKRLNDLGYHSVKVRDGDGWQGWADEAPFDAILVAAAAPRVPAALLMQLVEGGRLIIPVEDPDEEGEELLVYERRGEEFDVRSLGQVRFVPLKGEGRETIH